MVSFVRGDDLREDESVTIEPVWVLWVEAHELIEKYMSDRSHTHGGPGVTGIRCEGSIDLFIGVRKSVEDSSCSHSSRALEGMPSVKEHW